MRLRLGEGVFFVAVRINQAEIASDERTRPIPSAEAHFSRAERLRADGQSAHENDLSTLAPTGDAESPPGIGLRVVAVIPMRWRWDGALARSCAPILLHVRPPGWVGNTFRIRPCSENALC